jgi:hypothetical protein
MKQPHQTIIAYRWTKFKYYCELLENRQLSKDFQFRTMLIVTVNSGKPLFAISYTISITFVYSSQIWETHANIIVLLCQITQIVSLAGDLRILIL